MNSNNITDDIWDGGRRLPLAEDFYSLQGEGFHAGKPAYFIRLGGCDMGCPWCDAKYTWNSRQCPVVEVTEVADRAAASGAGAVVVTGGEPLLYPLEPLTEALHAHGLECLLETAGAHPFSGSFDWVCLSPKRQRPPLDEVCVRADELKVIVAGEDDLAWAAQQAARVGTRCRLYLQPEWSVAEQAMPLLVEYAKAHPCWNVSIQMHKYLQIP